MENEATPTQAMETVSFNSPRILGREQEYIADAIARTHFAGDGHYTRLASELLSASLYGAKVLLTPSCTHALELAALLLDVGPGDEIIVPSFTFVSTANAFMLRGARPIFCDIRADTLNLDETLVAGLISARTRAIVPVHYAGVACEMDALSHMAEGKGIEIVEDNAHGIFGAYRGRPLGSIGAMSALSFHETKNFSCGEGGALVINDPRFTRRAEIMREKGTNRSQFLRGAVEKYTWVDLGSSYLLSDLMAAFLFGQLEMRDRVTTRRRELFERYNRELASWAAQNAVRLPHVPEYATPSYHLFHLVLPTSEARHELMTQLSVCGVNTVFHYLPLHLSPMGRALGGRPGDCPVTESISDRLVRLPLFTTMSDDQQERVIAAVLRVSV